MRVVDVELHRVEEVYNLALLHRAAVDEVLVLASDDNLSSNGHLVEVIVAHGAIGRQQGGTTTDRSCCSFIHFQHFTFVCEELIA